MSTSARHPLHDAIALHQRGDLTRAAQIYRHILNSQPNNFDARHMLGILRDQQGRSDEALTLLTAALKLQPESIDALANYALVLGKLGRFDEALAALDRVLVLKPDAYQALGNRGLALLRLGRHDDAVHALDRAIAVKADYAEAYFNRGIALAQLRRHADALASYRQAIAIYERAAPARSDQAELFTRMGEVLAELKRPGDALAAHDRALALRPDYIDALINRGNALLDLDRPDDAVASYDRVLSLDPSNARALNNRASAFLALNRTREALADCVQALAIKPDYPDAQFNEGLALLLQGDFARGWPKYEYRWHHGGMAGDRRDFAQPQWTGEQKLRARRILVYAEQGLGDTIQFVRYVPLLAQAGATVLLEVPPALRGLLSRVPGVAATLSRGEPLPAFDLHCPLLSLPLAFKTDAASIPAAIPYLSPLPDRVARWRARLPPTDTRSIGLVWAGSAVNPNDRRRSIPLAELAPVLDAARGARVVSLQKDMRPADVATLAAWPHIVPLGEEFADFDDTAAAISLLDAVVAVDTAVAHVAGALGKPVFIMLPFAPDWRWQIAGEWTAWYPQAQLFRQTQRGRWDDVVQRVAAALAR